MAYKYYQPNKKDIKDNIGDCVIRALTKATGKEWLEVFDELIPYARAMQAPCISQQVYEAYLINHGYIYTGISNAKGTKRPTVASFAKSHKEGTFVLRVAHHVVTAQDGNYYDTWDSGEKSLYGYWTK